MPGYQPRHDTDPVWFNGTQVNSLTVASAQTGVRITAVYGWDERPDVRDVRELRSGQDGEYADNLYLGGRTITLEGEVYGSSWVNLQARKRTLAALFAPSSDEVLLKIPDPATASPTAVYATTGMTGYERVMCRVVEAIQFGDTLDPMCQVFQVILRASDPRVYSDTATSTDSGTTGTAARTVTVDQTGTYATPPTLTVTGPTNSDISVTEPSSGLTLSMSGLALTGTDVVEFDTNERTVNLTAGYTTIRTSGTYAPVGLWMLDEAAGATADNEEGTSARDGTYTGGYTLNQSGPFVGIASVALNGSTGYVSIPSVAALYPATNAIFEGWVKFDAIGATQTIIDGITSNKGFRVTLSATGYVQVRVGDGVSTASRTASGTALSAGTWYRIYTRANSAAISRIIVTTTSDVEVQSDSGSTSVDYEPATAGGYRIGSSLAGADFMDGNASAFAIYGENFIPSAEYPAGATATTSAYSYLQAASSRWANLGTASSTFTLSSSGLNTGSKLNVAYRDARL